MAMAFDRVDDVNGFNIFMNRWFHTIGFLLVSQVNGEFREPF